MEICGAFEDLWLRWIEDSYAFKVENERNISKGMKSESLVMARLGVFLRQVDGQLSQALALIKDLTISITGKRQKT